MIHTDASPIINDTGKELKGWHVLLIMLGFFGVMFAVNGLFLYHAITSFPGEDVKKSYVQGLNYNQTLSARASQADLGWRAEAGLQDGKIAFRLFDAEGLPLSNYAVIGELRRRATQDDDTIVTFTAELGGEYSAPIETLASGQWLLRVRVLDPSAETLLFEVEKTLFVS